MKIDNETIYKLAHLSRLDITEGEVETLKKDLEQIISWAEKLNELDVTNVPPMFHMTVETNVFREDYPKREIDKHELVSSAPEHIDNYFKVPKIIN